MPSVRVRQNTAPVAAANTPGRPRGQLFTATRVSSNQESTNEQDSQGRAQSVKSSDTKGDTRQEIVLGPPVALDRAGAAQGKSSQPIKMIFLLNGRVERSIANSIHQQWARRRESIAPGDGASKHRKKGFRNGGTFDETATTFTYDSSDIPADGRTRSRTRNGGANRRTGAHIADCRPRRSSQHRQPSLIRRAHAQSRGDCSCARGIYYDHLWSRTRSHPSARLGPISSCGGCQPGILR